jgi:hypothetical protein
MNKIESDQPAKFFVSYAPEDVEIASKLSRHLEGDGINVYDPYRYNWDIALDPEQIVNETDGVIIIMSPRSMPDRPEVTRQWLPFLRHQKRIYPVKIEECQIHHTLYSFMWLDATRGLGQVLPKFIEALRQYVPTPQPNLTDQSKVAVTDPPPTEPGIDFVGRRVGLSREAIDNNAVNDKPLTDVSQDKLGFAPYVFGLKEFLDSLDTETPLTIGLNGAWGSGKSSMMRMLESELKKRTIHGTFAARAKWTLDWICGTWWVGLGYLWSLILKLFRQTQRAEDIGTALHFGRSIPNMVTNEFDAQFHKFINLLIDDDAAKKGQQQMSTEERARHLADYQRRLEKWARRSYLRVLMPPARHYCVWFNAWKYSDQDQIWAALALATLRQLAKEKSLPGRVFIILRQTIRNLRTLNGNPLQFVQKNVLPALVAIAPLIYGLLERLLNRYSNGALANVVDQAKQNQAEIAAGASAASATLGNPNQASLIDLFTSLMNGDGLTPWTGALYSIPIALFWIGLRKIKSPINLAFAEALKSPKYDYSTQLGFLDTFEKDFEEIIGRSVLPSISNHPGKLVIFIDDLDRCTPTQTAEVIEAINLFLDSRGCVFILGMDMAIVAASIETKHEQLAKVLRQNSPDLVSAGALFLDKIIQIPLNVPRASDKSSQSLVKQMFHKQLPKLPKRRQAPPTASLPESAQPSPPVTPSTATSTPPDSKTDPVSRTHEKVSFARADIQDAIQIGSRLFNENIRQIKRFVNVFRLQIYISDKRQLLSDDKKTGLSPDQLAVWVAWQMRWPELTRQMMNPLEKETLTNLLCGLADKIEIDSFNNNGLDGRLNGSVDDLIEPYFNTAAGERLKPFFDNWLRDQEFLYSVKYLEQYWSGEKPLDILLDLPHPMDLTHKASMTSSS